MKITIPTIIGQHPILLVIDELHILGKHIMNLRSLSPSFLVLFLAKSTSAFSAHIPAFSPLVKACPVATSTCISSTTRTTRRHSFLTATQQDSTQQEDLFLPRRAILQSTILSILLPLPVFAKCTDIESCREIGERKVEKDLVDNPVTTLQSGSRYKVLQPGTGDASVDANSSLDLIFSISTLSGGYMYSQGFGYEKIDAGNGKTMSDAGSDSVRVKIGERNVPIGIEDALLGMKKGERRRVEVPPSVGFITSNWKPEPTSKRGKAGVTGYKRILEGNGPNQPAFPAATIWDVEVLRIRK